MGWVIFLKKGLFMRENFFKPRRSALSDASLFLAGGGHLSLIPLPGPLARTPRSTRLSERHPLSIISYLLSESPPLDKISRMTYPVSGGRRKGISV
jgi:hypothetical protein